MKVKSKLDVAKEALGDELSRVAGELYEIEQAEKRRPALLAELKQVKAALVALSAPAEKPAREPRRLKAKPEASALRKLAIAKAAKGRPAKVPTDPRAVHPGNPDRVALGVTDAAFMALWNAAASVTEVANRLKVQPKQVQNRAARMRRGGYELRAYRSKPAADAEERPVAPVIEIVCSAERRVGAASVPRPSSFRLFARAAASGDVVKRPKATQVHREVTRGEIRGHWEALVELGPSEHGTRMMRVRSTCEAKTERRTSVSDFFNDRLPATCRACRAKNKPPKAWTEERRALVAGRPPVKSEMPETYRCTALDQGHPCGALVFAKKRADHLADVHDNHGGDVAASFTGPLATEAEAA